MNDKSMNSPEFSLRGALKDVATVSETGKSLKRLTEGVVIRKLTTHVDERGSVAELFDERWGYPDPLTFSYMCTIRPGIVKGWGLHEKHEDRYVFLEGEMQLLLYDVRPHSSTYGELCIINLSEYDRCLINIPTYVWHADYNFGSKDAVIINFPTAPFNHAAPDKLRLPIDTDLIPHRFPQSVRGG